MSGGGIWDVCAGLMAFDVNANQAAPMIGDLRVPFVFPWVLTLLSLYCPAFRVEVLIDSPRWLGRHLAPFLIQLCNDVQQACH